MKNQKFINIKSQQDKGQVFIELALLLPFIILVIASVFEFGRMMTHRHLLDRITYEGLRLGSNLYGLESQENITNEYFVPEDETDYPSHRLLQLRVAQLLTLSGFDLGNLSVTSGFTEQTFNSPTVDNPRDAAGSNPTVRRGFAVNETSLLIDPAIDDLDIRDPRDETSTPQFVGGRVSVVISSTYEPLLFKWLFSVPMSVEKVGISLANRFTSVIPKNNPSNPSVTGGGPTGSDDQYVGDYLGGPGLHWNTPYGSIDGLMYEISSAIYDIELALPMNGAPADSIVVNR